MSTPRRWGAGSSAWLLLSMLAAACGDSDEALDPELRVPNTGSYAYEALVYTEEGTPPDTFSGTLSINVASEDSILGTWDVDGYAATVARGIWNINAYTLPADPSPPLQGDITHRVWRQNNSGDLSCALTYERVTMPADTFTTSSENRCSLDAL